MEENEKKAKARLCSNFWPWLRLGRIRASWLRDQQPVRRSTLNCMIDCGRFPGNIKAADPGQGLYSIQD